MSQSITQAFLDYNEVHLSKDYHEWLLFIEEHNDPNYTENMLKFARDIVSHTKQQKQASVAKCLRMPQPRFSILFQVIKLLAEQGSITCKTL